MGGEKSTGLRVSDVLEGSPPHGRGKAGFSDAIANSGRITPAWAGKSCGVTFQVHFIGDHPRMGGEKDLEHRLFHSVQGSPPHGRGKD